MTELRNAVFIRHVVHHQNTAASNYKKLTPEYYHVWIPPIFTLDTTQYPVSAPAISAMDTAGAA